MQQILLQYKALLDKYEKLVKEYEQSDIVNENIKMKNENTGIQNELAILKSATQKLKTENDDLRLSLNEQIIDEKKSILKISQNKLNTYFWNSAHPIKNRLHNFEVQITRKMKQLNILAKEKLDDDKLVIMHELNMQETALRKKVEERRAWLEEKAEKEVKEKMTAGYRAFNSEGVDSETIQKRIKQNKLELKFGLNWINKIGILLIVIAVGYASKYSYSRWFTNYAKGITFFILGGSFVAIGEWFYRKGKDIFSKGILGGGISILYGAAFYSFFTLQIINLNTGIFLSILITTLSIALALRYNSKTICTLALIGGYLPFFSYVFNFTFTLNTTYTALGYILILNLTLLIISFQKKWLLPTYASFALNMPCVIYLTDKLTTIGMAQDIYSAMAFLVLTFAVYLGIILSYPLKYNVKLQKLDLFFLALNTIINCTMLYSLFTDASLDNFRGLLALLYAATYIVLANFVSKKMNNERETMILFYITALTFAILMVPFQFGVTWLSMGLLIEGILLILAGHHFKIKYMERAGMILFGGCVCIFYLFDFFVYFIISDNIKFFKLKYTLVTVGIAVTLWRYVKDMIKQNISEFSETAKNIFRFKYFAIGNIWFFLFFTIIHYYNKFIPNAIYKILGNNTTAVSFYRLILISIFNITFAYVITKIKTISDRKLRMFSGLLYIASLFICLFLNFQRPTLHYLPGQSTIIEYFGIGLLIAFNAFSLLFFRELILNIFKKHNLNIEYYPLGVCLFLIFLLSTLVINQLHIGEENLILSFAYIGIAISSIIFGFKRKYIYIRIFGLSLMMISVVKVIVFDLRHLTRNSVGLKILAYFTLGALLIGVSFIYQKVKTNIETTYEKK